MLALEVFADMQKQYISEARQKYENTRTFRHDVNNHIKMLTNLIKNEEIKNANAYLMRFEDEAKDMSFEVFTGNAVIDVLLKCTSF